MKTVDDDNNKDITFDFQEMISKKELRLSSLNFQLQELHVEEICVTNKKGKEKEKEYQCNSHLFFKL